MYKAAEPAKRPDDKASKPSAFSQVSQPPQFQVVKDPSKEERMPVQQPYLPPHFIPQPPPNLFPSFPYPGLMPHISAS